MIEHRLEAADAGRTLEVAAGDRVVVALEELSGAGYTWLVAEQPDAVSLTDRYEHTPGVGIGGSSRRVFDVEAQDGARGRLVLVQRRPWENETPAIGRFEVRLDPPAGGRA